MPNPINDAEAYGVRILPVEVTPGESYWQVTSVHHRTPEENGGKHHLYFDVLDEGGARLFGARVLIRWDGGSQEVAIEKPLSEPGANFPMWKWQICNAQALGLPSDRVENLHTGHDDEPPGNTLFHHSFDITFRRVVKETTAPPRQSVIQGRMPGGAGQTLVLSTDATEIAQTQVAADERFRFAELAAGRYTIRAAAAGRQIGPVAVDGWETVEIDFPQPATPPPPRRRRNPCGATCSWRRPNWRPRRCSSRCWPIMRPLRDWLSGSAPRMRPRPGMSPWWASSRMRSGRPCARPAARWISFPASPALCWQRSGNSPAAACGICHQF